MAEGFARRYGSDVLNASSAGLLPAPIVQPETIEVMAAKNIDIEDQFPKSIHEVELETFDFIVNMSGTAFPVAVRAEVVRWDVTDPMGQPEEVYLRVRDHIEKMVMQLILQLRRGVPGPVQGALELKTADVPKTRLLPVRAKPAVKNLAAKPDEPPPQRFGFGRVRRARD